MNAGSWMLELKLLGPFEAEAGALALRVPGLRRRALLAYLATRPNGRESRERLVALLWADAGPESGRHSLRQALLELKRDLGAEPAALLQSDRGHVVLDVTRVAVDAVLFERLAWSSDADEMTRAMRLYRGEFLTDLTGHIPALDDWARDERARLHQLAVSLFERVLEVPAMPAVEAVQAARRLVAQDPLDELAQRLLIRTLARHLGRRAALAQAEALQTLLRAELDVDPDPETMALIREIREGRP